MVDISAGSDDAQPGAVSPKAPRIRWLLHTLFWIVTFICSGFTATASLVLWGSLLHWGVDDDPGLATRLLVKGLLFAALTAVAFRWIRMQARAWQRLEDSTKSETPTDVRGQPLALALALVAVAAIVVPFLGTYPHIEPDESHHLIVARNIAEFGVYGSGHPDTGFEWFDDYDSVGPPVILPVALSLKLGGVSLFAGRIVMPAFFLLLCYTVYLLSRPLFGTSAAITAVVLAAMAVGSAYLGRTLYGEVPAMLLLVTGLWCWRGSIYGKHVFANAALAGLCFGLMVATKFFMVFVAWAFLGALVYDRITFRKIRVIHIVVPAAFVVLLVAVWLGIQRVYRPDNPDVTAGYLSMYRHNLMFGLDPVRRTLGWILNYPLTLLVSVIAMIAAGPVVFYRRYDPVGSGPVSIRAVYRVLVDILHNR